MRLNEFAVDESMLILDLFRANDLHANELKGDDARKGMR